MDSDLPFFVCHRAALGELSADVSASFWPSLPAMRLVDTVTGKAPKQATEVRIAWDAAEVRILFCATDVDPWATLTERDAPLYMEEVVEVFIDPVGDLLSYF